MDNKVVIERHFKASLQSLWEHWTDPRLFAAWFGPGDTTAQVTKYEVTEGMPYEVLVIEPSGVTHVTTGVFTVVVPHQELAFTWKINDLDMEESLVTVLFSGDEHTSTLRLTQERLTAKHAQMHEFGWNAAFIKLTNTLAQ